MEQYQGIYLLNQARELDDESAWRFLDDDTRSKIEREFVTESLDAEDHEACVMALLNGGKERLAVAERMLERWWSYVASLRIADEYRDEIERNYLSQYET